MVKWVELALSNDGVWPTVTKRLAQYGFTALADDCKNTGLNIIVNWSVLQVFLQLQV